MSENPLSGVRVLDFTHYIAGPYCTKLLADLGARVVKVEAPRTGDPARSYGPFPGDIPHPEKSGLFLFLNTNKQSITLNPALPTGREMFIRLVSCADVLVEDTQPGTMKELGLDSYTLQEIYPRLVYISITAYGQDGPKASWRAYHLNSFHASGEGYTLPGGIGHALFPHRAPVTAGVHLGEYDAGLLAASATVAALYAREFWGEGQHVDLSKQEATLALNRLTHAQFLGQGIATDRSRSYEYGGIYPCRDGYVILYPREDRHWKVLVEIMGKPALAEDKRFHTRAARIQHGEDVNRLLGEWTSNLSKEEIYYRVAPSGCPAAFFATPEEVFRSPQLEARQFFAQIEHPVVGPLKYPSRPYRFSACPWPVARPAPLLGQHNEEIFCGELGISREELADLRRGGVI